MEAEEREVLERARMTLGAAAEALPRAEDLQELLQQVEDAQNRGYFLPGEDDDLRQVYASYLAVRSSLWEVVLSLRSLLGKESRLEIFGVAFCGAAMLLRSANFVIGLGKDRPIIRRKLDEAESRYGLEWKSYTRIYRSVSSIRWMWRYQDALRFYEANREEILASLREVEMSQVADWLEEEEPFFERARRLALKRRLAYRWYSFCRRHVSGYRQVMFGIFRLGGSAIAEMRQPFMKKKGGKRVTEQVLAKARERMQPGDVIVTRHDDAMSNLFLPGFWPHAALYLGDGETLEAKKDGVKFRELSETLEVDAFLVLRSNLASAHIQEALARARTHAGKLYDFVFDFSKSDRLVCTEVVYRGYDGIAGVSFSLIRQSGRHCLPAEELIRQSLAEGWFSPRLCYGVEGDDFFENDEAQAVIEKSLTLPPAR